MKKINDKTIIGVDHGYGYVKTANAIIKSGVEELPIKPPFTEDILEYNGKIYCVGQMRSEHLADKTVNQDYYLLTLAAIAKEMEKSKTKRLNNVILAVGLPYSFISQQQADFRKYLFKNKSIDFVFEGKKYHVGLKDVKIYPQGFPVIAKDLERYADRTVSVVDIGSRTIDILTFRNGKPLYDKCFSIDSKGTIDCMNGIKKYYLAEYQSEIEEEDIQRLFQNLPVTLPEDKIKFIKKFIKIYINDVLKQLSAKGITRDIIFCGGGATVINNYYPDLKDAKIVSDIYINAAGFEMLATNMVKTK